MIVVVEDEKELCESLKMLLTEKGYEIVTARSCDEADKYIGNPQIDMFLLDVKLPDGSGFDLCRKIRKSSEVPVIFLTSSPKPNSCAKISIVSPSISVESKSKTANFINILKL